MFKSVLATEKENLIKTSVASMIKADPRLNFMQQRVESRLMRGGQIGKSRITVDNIDSEVYNFPPCMSHLHFLLRRRHRLSHNARFYYSLYLKDCGMAVDQALAFWREEYSQPHTCTHSCSHNWQTDEKRFTYSIRHLYGLEGSRKSYSAPNCSAICVRAIESIDTLICRSIVSTSFCIFQNKIDGPNYEGGCPFKSFDKEKLKEVLEVVSKQGDAEKYLDTLLSQRPEVACASFLKLRRIENKENTCVNSPVQYYQLMIEYD